MMPACGRQVKFVDAHCPSYELTSEVGREGGNGGRKMLVLSASTREMVSRIDVKDDASDNVSGLEGGRVDAQ